MASMGKKNYRFFIYINIVFNKTTTTTKGGGGTVKAILQIFYMNAYVQATNNFKCMIHKNN